MRYWRTADRSKVDDFLVHHGIEGQKWGVSHGPPYPLDRKISTGEKLVSNLPHKRVAANRMGKYTKKQQSKISEGQVTGATVGGLVGANAGGYITKKAINQGYTNSNLDRINAAQRMGGVIAGPVGQLVGAKLAKKHIDQENAGERDDKYTDEERVRINNAFSMYGLAGTALSRHNVKKENKQAAQDMALSVADNMEGLSRDDFEVTSTKRTKDGNNYIIEVTNKEDKDIKAYVKVTKDKDTGDMSISNIGLTEEDAKSGSVESNAEKLKAKADSYDDKPATDVKLTNKDKKTAQQMAMNIVDDESNGDYKVTNVKKDPDGDGFIVAVENKNEPDLDAYVSVKKDSKTGKMVVNGAGQTESDILESLGRSSNKSSGNKSSGNSDWKYEDSENNAKVSDSTIKSVRKQVAKYAQSTQWGNNNVLKFVESREIELPNGKTEYEFSFGNGYALFTVYGTKDSNGKIVLNTTKNGNLDVDIMD